MSNTQIGVGTLPSYVTSTAALTTGEMSVAIAFLTLFGRPPDKDGLAYWVGQVGSSASVATAVDTIKTAISGSDILDSDNGVTIALMYYHLLGKTVEDDPAGQAYWVSLLNSGTSFGNIVNTVYSIINGISDYYADTMKNRVLALEAVCRLQKAQNYSLSIQDSRSAVLRVDGVIGSFDEAMVDIYRLLVNRVASTALSWGKSWNSTSFASNARLYNNSSIMQCRNVVWYNREGNMMLATFYLPSNFTAISTHHTIVALHGGGWRQGYPEKIYSYCTALASGINPSYVVAAPTYRLTAYGFTSPSPENDVQDFYGLLDSATFIRQGTKAPSMFGESSGAHLACLVGSKINASRVFAIYPPIDLTGATSVSALLDKYADYYTPNSILQTAASPNLVWTSARTTKFELWHGTSDPLVPSEESTTFDNVVGTNCNVTLKIGEGHGFTTPVRAEVVFAARAFFNI